MRHTHVSGYRSGDYWVVCPRCGFDWLQSRMVEEEDTGKVVCPDCKDDSEKSESISRKGRR